MSPHGSEEFIKEKRFIMVHLVIVLVIQIIVLLGYYFKEQQTILAFPMLLSILMTALAIGRVWQFGRRK